METSLLSKTLLLTGIPVFDTSANPAKLAKLRAVLLQHISSKEHSIEPVSFNIALSGGSTLGHAFAQYNAASDIDYIVSAVGRQVYLDKSTSIGIYRANGILDVCQTSEDYIPLNESSVQKTAALSRWNWLLDPDCRDQLAVGHGQSVNFQWINFDPEPPITRTFADVKIPKDSKTKISTRGSYLISHNDEQLTILAGSDFQQIATVRARGVSNVSVSPLETYVITDTTEFAEIWNVETGKLRHRAKFTDLPSLASRVGWSFDERFIAYIVTAPAPTSTSTATSTLSTKAVPVAASAVQTMLTKSWAAGATSQLLVFETEQWTLVEDLCPVDVRGFSWSPEKHHLVYWTAERGHTPSCITVLALESRKMVQKVPDATKPQSTIGICSLKDIGLKIRTVSTKQVYGIIALDSHWASDGMLVACRVDRKVRKTTTKPSGNARIPSRDHVTIVITPTIDIFRFDTGDSVPESLELDGSSVTVSKSSATTDYVSSFAISALGSPIEWEPLEHRFFVATSNGRVDVKTAITLYSVGQDTTTTTTTKITKMETSRASRVAWSPLGELFVSATVAPQGVPTEFLFCRIPRQDTKIETLKRLELGHSRLAWSLSGLILATWLLQEDRGNSETAYSLWNVLGTALGHSQDDGLNSVTWRPRPTMLSPEERRETAKQATSASSLSKYRKECALRTVARQEEIIRQRRQAVLEYLTWKNNVVMVAA